MLYPFEPIKAAKISVEFACTVWSHNKNSIVNNEPIFVGDFVGTTVGIAVVGFNVGAIDGGWFGAALGGNTGLCDGAELGGWLGAAVGGLVAAVHLDTIYYLKKEKNNEIWAIKNTHKFLKLYSHFHKPKKISVIY